MVELGGEDKTNVMAEINQTVVNYFIQVMQMDGFTLRQKALIDDNPP